MKKCSVCLVRKPKEEFYKNKYAKDKLTHQCKTCLKKRSSGWKKNNPEKTRNSRREWNAQNQDVMKVMISNWKLKNPNKIKIYQDRWKTSHRDCVRRNARVYMRRRRAQMKGVKTTKIPDTRELLHSQNGMCAICNRVEDDITPHTLGHKWELDHIVSLYNGGPHAISNVQVLCWKCNNKKGSS